MAATRKIKVLIPIFGSCPTHLSDSQHKAYRLILGELGRVGLEWRSIGQTDYPTEFPLREVLMLGRRCAGGVILGFQQFETSTGVWKKGTPYKKRQKGAIAFPTPWNQLEAGLLFSLRIPLLVFREKLVVGGVFDNGVTDVFVQEMPNPNSAESRRTIREILRRWAAKVHAHYYEEI